MPHTLHSVASPSHTQPGLTDQPGDLSPRAGDDGDNDSDHTTFSPSSPLNDSDQGPVGEQPDDNDDQGLEETGGATSWTPGSSDDNQPLTRKPHPPTESAWEEQTDPRLAFIGAPSLYTVQHPANILRRVRERARVSVPRVRYPTRSASIVVQEEKAVTPDGVTYILRSTWAAQPGSTTMVTMGTQTEKPV